MKRLKELYRRHIYGVIGTLAFHLILLTIFLLAELKTSRMPKDEGIILDFTEQPPPQLPEPEVKKEKAASQSSSESADRGSNRAVNDASKQKPTKDKFFDKAYREEIEKAKALVNDVNKTLSQKIPEIGDIKMPEETTEGMKPEEIKHTIYKGKSNIHYSLKDRYHVRLPIPIYLAQGGGEVTVDIVVDRSGRVLSAEPRPNPNITDPMLYAYAKKAAENTEFNADANAPEKQRGTITYNFVPQ
jgi:TonB family protein